MIRLHLFIILLCFLSLSCKDSGDGYQRPDVSDIKVNVEIVRLERKLSGLNTVGEVKAFLAENKPFAQNFLNAGQYPDDSVLAQTLLNLYQDPAFDTVYQESQKIFGDMDKIKQDFETAFKYIKYYYPKFEPPAIYTMVTGFGQDLFVSDEMIVIGLDFFSGPEATYRPVEVPAYIQRRYTPAHVVPSVVLLLSQKFNESDPESKSMLADLIYYGKSYYFTDFVLPNTADSLIIGYTAEEMAGTEVNKATIWAHFLKNELLYETSHVVKKKYLDERPNTYEIGNKAPGRIGTWLGWQIVKAFMEEQEEVKLPELMQEKKAQLILEKSKYRPQVK